MILGQEFEDKRQEIYNLIQSKLTWEEIKETGIFWLKFDGSIRRFYTEIGRPTKDEISETENGFA